MTSITSTRRARVALLALALSACATAAPSEGEPGWHPPLDSTEDLFANAPDNDTLPLEGKADIVFPPRFDLLSQQTPVRNQGSRGSCSFFSTIALVEQTYVRDGLARNPDFSEQYAVWLLKGKVGLATDRDSSWPGDNLEQFAAYGLVDEALWPYSPTGWGQSDDPACVGPIAMQPVRCRTQGEPSAEALAAPVYKIPGFKHVNPERTTVKTYLYEQKAALVLSLPVHYQAWNFWGGPLPISSDLYSRGIVTYPNDEDRAHYDSLGEAKSSHAMLLVGWDEELAVPARNARGEPVLDDMGQPVMEEGFYILKNSWGTSTMGSTSPVAPGYLMISMRYVEANGSLVTIDAPTVVRAESCFDGLDDDQDGAIDCDDTDCAGTAVCLGSRRSTSAAMSVPVPDGSTEGVHSVIEVSEDAPAIRASVTLTIEHEAHADLQVTLKHGEHSYRLPMPIGAGRKTLILEQSHLIDEEASGAWELIIVDRFRVHTGSLIDWTLNLAVCDEASGCNLSPVERRVNGYDRAIPDATAPSEPGGVETGETLASQITMRKEGDLDVARVTVEIEHPDRSELDLDLVREADANNRERLVLPLYRGELGPGRDLEHTFELFHGFSGTAHGTWKLEVRDRKTGGTGTLKGWTLELVRCGPFGCRTPKSYYDAEDDHSEIPDAEPVGLDRDLEMEGTGTVTGVNVHMSFTHPRLTDLTLILQRITEGGRIEREVVLRRAGMRSTSAEESRIYDANGFEGLPVAGAWRLKVVDEVAESAGSLDWWSVVFTTTR